MSGEFDRLRPRDAAAPAPSRGPGHGLGPDREGKRALFSADVPPSAPQFGAVSVTCSGCQATTVLTPGQALVSALRSVHLPLVRRGHPSWMRCPACGRRTWVRVGLRW
jgi:hypothetical protein